MRAMRLSGNGRLIGIRSCTALARGREILADASRNSVEKLQRFQHDTRNFCSALLISCYKGEDVYPGANSASHLNSQDQFPSPNFISAEIVTLAAVEKETEVFQQGLR